jgi:hypothetical protein
MTRPPGYMVHKVDERDVTVDWFFAHGQARHRIRQFALMVVGWVFAILPVAITASALLDRNGSGGWWKYPEGYYLWDVTTLTLGFLIAVFIIGFFALYIANRASAGKRDQRKTYDPARLSRHLELAADLYRSKWGTEAFRLERKNVVIEPHKDVETYELRDHYRKYGAD